METFFVTLVIAAVAVAGMILGLSITLLRKGHYMQSDIGDNDAMRERGIECASAQIRREDALLRGEDPSLVAGCGKGMCSDCAVDSDCVDAVKK